MESDSRIGHTRPVERVTTLGTLLRNARKAASLTMRDVEAGAGLSKSHLCCIENDQSVPGLLVAARLSRLYGVGLDALVAQVAPATAAEVAPQ